MAQSDRRVGSRDANRQMKTKREGNDERWRNAPQESRRMLSP